MGSWRRWLLAFVAVLTLVVTGGIIANPQAAFAADGDVTLVKSASPTSASPGDTVIFTIGVSCSSQLAGCIGATLTDPVPDEFEIVGVTIGTGLQGESTVDGQDVNVDFTFPVGGGVGLPAGTTGVVTITTVMRDLPYEANGVPITNTATSDADTQTSGPLSSSATVTPEIPLELAASGTKTISPTDAVAAPGTELTATITTRNDSNANVDAIVITDPADPSASPNPFETIPFTGFGTVTFPDGADQVQVDVWNGTEWVTGTPSDVATLPDGIAPEDVLGLRFTFTNSAGTGIPPGSSASVDLDLVQGDSVTEIADSQTVTNSASGEVVLGDQTASTPSLDASYTINAEDIVLTAGKQFSPDEVAAGDSSTVTIDAGNSSAFALPSLTITEPALVGGDPTADGFTADAAFSGFTAPITWPAGATAGTITYYYADGTSETLPLVDGAVPPPPADGQTVARFSVTFTGAIEQGASVDLAFQVATNPDETAYPLTVSNEVGVSATGPAGGFAEITANDDLLVFGAHIETVTSKSIFPSEVPQAPGQWVIVTMGGAVAGFPETTIPADSIVVQDPTEVPYDVDGTFWDTFNVTEISDTAVPADANLTIEYWDGTQWVVLPGAELIEGPTIYSQDIPEDLQDDIQGLRFTFTAKPGEELEPGTAVEPHFTAEVRPTERDPSTTTTAPAAVENCAAGSSGSSDQPDIVDPGSSACASVNLLPSTPGTGGILIGKSFTDNQLTARSQEQVTANIDWSTAGYAGVRTATGSDIVDPETTPLIDSFYNAFDIVRVLPITPETDPYLKYDQITDIQLWDGSEWRDLANDPCPAACDGTFPGVTLLAADRDAAQSIRWQFVESPTRVGATPTDPTAPPVGSGVARSSGFSRQISLVFQLRDFVREPSDPPTPVTGSLLYNEPGQPGVVRNSVEGTGVFDNVTVPAQDSDIIRLVDVPLNVGVTKTWSGSPFGIPPASVPAENYPTGRVHIEATNETAAKVDSLTITDPGPDAPGNPFEFFNLIDFRILSVPAGADETDTVVRLSRSTDGNATPDITEDYTRAEALALTEPDLENVVGVEVLHNGRIGSNATAILEMDLRMRKFERSFPGIFITVADGPILNEAQAQVDDVGGGVVGSNSATDTATDDATFTDIELGVTAGKSFSPATQAEPDDSPVTMTLTGQPIGSGRAAQMTITDDTDTFWNAFDFAGIDPSFSLTSPIDRVSMDVYTGATFTDDGGDLVRTGGAWSSPRSSQTLAEFLADPLPPGIVAADVQAVRFTFTSADGSQWENPTNPVQAVPVLVQRRDDLRSGGEVPSDRDDFDPAPGETVAGTFTDQATATASSFLGAGAVQATDTTPPVLITYTHAETSATITKGPDDAQLPGRVIPFTITVQNDGEWPIIDPVIVDTLPSDADGPLLVFDPAPVPGEPGPYSYALTGNAPAPPSGPQMPVDTADVDEAATASQITFTFPPGTVLEVGQSYTITVELLFRTGLPGGTEVTNDVSLTSERPFDACNGEARTPETAADPCEADTTVTVLSAGAARSGKLVRALDTELGVFPALSGYTCTPDADGFYAPPCTPVTKPGGDEEWRLGIVNTGNIPMDEVTLVDRLPAVGDTGALNDLQRKSAWKAVFNGGAELALAPAGSTFRFFYATSDAICTDDLDFVGAECSASDWTEVADPDSVAGDASITAIKVVVELATPLQPTGRIYVDFLTTTPPVSETAGRDTIAWNTVATGAHLTEVSDATGAPTLIPVEGTKIGVALATGAVLMLKTASGPGADAYAPDSYDVTLECTSVGVELPPIETTLELGQLTRIDNLPWGAECTLVEGENGQVSATSQGATVYDPADVGGPPIQTATLVNDYELAGIELSKTVESDARDEDGGTIAYGPFEATVECTFLGEPVFADGYDADDPMVVSIADGDTETLTGLPANAECAVSESNAKGATGVEISGATSAGAVPAGDASGVDLVLTPDDGDDPTNSADIVNSFDVGSLSLVKQVTGPGAADFAHGPYIAHVTCILTDESGSRTVWDDNVTLDGPTPITVTIDDIAAGAVCRTIETDNGVADNGTVAPASITVGASQTASVTITNTFLTGSLQVTKELTGDGAELYGNDSFEATLRCVDFDGGAAIVSIPGGGVRTLNASNSLTTLYDPLPAGAFCVLGESDAGDATSSQIVDEDGDPVGIFRVADGVQRSFRIVNTFDTGSLTVTKTVTGDGAEAWGTEDFTVSLSCEAVLDGVLQPIDIPGGAERTLSVDTALSVTYDLLPPGAECEVRETGSGGATETTLTPNGGDPAVGTATIALDTVANIDIENRFDLGSIRVTKTLSGTGAELDGVGTFTVHLECTRSVNGVEEPIDIPGGADRALSRDTTLVTVYDGLPADASCELTEPGNGDSSATIIIPNAGDKAVGVATVVANDTVDIGVDNRFDVGRIIVTKEVAGEGAAAYGDQAYVVALSCQVTSGGTVVNLPVPGGPVRTLSSANGYEAVYDLLPDSAPCELRELNARGATSTVMTPNSGVAAVGTAIVRENEDVTIDIVNTFDVGSLTIEKVVEGAGAEAFGSGPFTMHVTCRLEEGPAVQIEPSGLFRPVYDEDVVLGGDQPLSATIDGLPVNSECGVAETDDGFADVSVVSPEVVTIVPGDPVVVTVTNTFLAGSLVIRKQVTGDGAELYGTGPFEVRVRCVDVDSGVQVVDVPGGAVRELTAENGFSTTYDLLPNGAFCRVVETVSAGATSSHLVDADADDAPVALFRVGDGVERHFTLINQFDTGSIVVTKTLSGGGATELGGGDYTVELSCTTVVDDETVDVVIPDGAERVLSRDTTLTTRYDDLPAGAACSLVESDAGGADAVSYTPAAAGDDSFAAVVVEAGAAVAIGVDNSFDAVPPSGLAGTGFTGGVWIPVGIVLLLAGGVVLTLSVRRRRHGR